MIKLRDEDLQVRLTVGDAGSAQTAGAEFARTLAGAASADFMVALAEQGDLVRRWIVEAGYPEAQARLATGHFEAAARAEWQRISDPGTTGPGGRA